MSGRFFLDTNVFVYTFDPNVPDKARRADQLIRKALISQKGVVSYQVVQEFFNIALRRFAQPMRMTEAEQYLRIVFQPLLSVHSSTTLYADALRLQSASKLSWYDSLIVSSAVQANCDLLYTDDLQHEQRFGTLQVKNPFV